jgi:hypothetical protein
VNFAARFWVGEKGVKIGRMIKTESLHHQTMDCELVGGLAGIRRLAEENEQGVIGVNLIDDNRIFFCKVSSAALNHWATARDSRRSVDLEAFQPHSGNFVPRPQQGQQPGVDGHFANFDQGRCVRPVLVQHQSFNNYLDAGKESYVDGRDLHAALKVGS